MAKRGWMLTGLLKISKFGADLIAGFIDNPKYDNELITVKDEMAESDRHSCFVCVGDYH